MNLPIYSETGLWKVGYALVHDDIGNYRQYSTAELKAAGFPVELNVVSSQPDTKSPQLVSVKLIPSFVDTTSGPRNLILLTNFTDNLAGIDWTYRSTSPNAYNQAGYFYYSSPSGRQTRSIGLAATPIAGTALNGAWKGTSALPQYSEAGTWTLTGGSASDLAGNTVYYDAAQLTAMGIQSSFEVILPTLITDATIPVAGGTAVDDVFGNRAKVTVPPGVLSQPATISIDVLASNLNLPVPTGFSTNATNFVNIKMTPEPTPPFAAPGLTIVLPLLNQMAPGTVLTLYRVDPANGNLLPEPGLNGAAATGTVDASGTSATFTGVTSLSIVVGLIPNGTVLGDVDGDGEVNCADVAVVRQAFGKKLGQPGFDSRADTNRDNVVNVLDLSFVSRRLSSQTVCRITPTGAITLPGNGTNPLAPR